MIERTTNELVRQLTERGVQAARALPGDEGILAQGWMREIQKGGSEDELCHLVGCAYYAQAKITHTYGADSAFAILSKEVTVAIHTHLICLAGGHESQILELMNA